MNNQNDNLTNVNDEIIEELWKAKDHYSESCSSDFSRLVDMVKKDIEHIPLNKINEIEFEEATS